MVYLEFDDEQMMISAKSIFIHHINVIVSQIPYSNLKLENSENQYDGMTRGTYLAMHLYDRNKILVCYYKIILFGLIQNSL